jgi:quinol monooxygenase YgiN
MSKVALFVRITAKPETAAKVAEFLRSALPLVEAEPETSAWYALQFSREEFAIFDTFPGEAGRKAHLEGKVAAALMASIPTLLACEPTIEHLDVLAVK